MTTCSSCFEWEQRHNQNAITMQENAARLLDLRTQVTRLENERRQMITQITQCIEDRLRLKEELKAAQRKIEELTLLPGIDGNTF